MLFLDYLIVISLSALFVPHYVGIALGIDAIARRPGDLISAVVVVALIGAVRLLRRTKLYSFSFAVPILDLVNDSQVAADTRRAEHQSAGQVVGQAGIAGGPCRCSATPRR